MANGHTWWKWEPGIKADRMLFSCCFWKEWLLFQQRKELRLHGAMQQVWPGCAGEKLSTWREGLALGVGFINHCIHSFNMKTGKKKRGGGVGRPTFHLFSIWKAQKGDEQQIGFNVKLTWVKSSQQRNCWQHRGSKGSALRCDPAGCTGQQWHCCWAHRCCAWQRCQLFICSKTESEKYSCWKASCLEASKRWCDHTCGPLQLWHYSFLFFVMYLLILCSCNCL